MLFTDCSFHVFTAGNINDSMNVICYTIKTFQKDIPFLEWQCNREIVITMPVYVISKIASGQFHTSLLYEIPSILYSIFAWMQWRCYTCKTML